MEQREHERVLVGFDRQGKRMLHSLAVDTTITRNTLMTLLVVLAVTWLPSAILSLVEGGFYDGTIYSFLLDPDTQIRLMLALPISILCQPMIRQGCKIVTDYATRNLVPPDQHQERWLPVLERAQALEQSVLVSILLAVVVIVIAVRTMFNELSIIDGSVHLWYAKGSGDGATFTLAGWWYYLVAIPIYQFIMARLLWMYLVWIWVLWRLSRTDLQIIAVHGDHMGGLSVLAAGQFGYMIYLFSMTTKIAGLLTLEILSGELTFEAARMQMFTAVVIGVVVVMAPMVLFVNDLTDARRRAVLDYATLSTHYGRRFHARWIEGARSTDDTDEKVDASFMADFNAVYETATTLRRIPISLKGVILVFGTLASPYILIMLTQFSPEQLLVRLIDILS